MAEKVYTKNAPDAIGPYTQAIKTNGFVFTSGQIAINPQTGNVEATTIEGQTEQVMKNLGAILAEAGSSFDKAVKTVCFLADMGDLQYLMRFMVSILQASQLVHVLLLRHFQRMFL